MFSDDGRSGASIVLPPAEDDETDPVLIPPVSHSFGKCGACRSTFRPNRSPQLLPCLHSLCKMCVPQPGSAESTRECPVCQRAYTLLEVTDNPFLKESASGPGTHTASKCAGCEETAVSGWCVECGEALCSICVSAHQRVRVTRDHTVLPQKLPAGFTPTVFCPTHREEPVKLFCMTCDKLTCRDCQLTYHRNHSYQFLDEAVTSQRVEIESLLVRVKQQREGVKQSLLDLDGRLLDLVEIKSKVKDELQKMLVYIRYALMKRAMRLLKDVQGLCGGEAERIAERQDALKSLQKRQEFILAFTEKALGTDDHTALLSCKRLIQSQLQDVLSQNAMPAASMLEVTFHCDQDACSRVAAFGNIVTKEVPFSRSDPQTVQNKSLDHPLQTQSNSHHHPAAQILPSPSSSHPATSSLFSPTSCHTLTTSTIVTAASVPCSPLSTHSTLSSSHSTHSPTLSIPASSFSSVHSHLAPAPQTSTLSDSHLQQSTPSPPSSSSQPVRSHTLHSKSRRPKQTWSFHPYQPKNPKPTPKQIRLRSPEPSQTPLVVSQPSTPSLPVVPESQSPPVTLFPVTPPPLIMVLSPLGTNILDVNLEKRNGHTVQTANTDSSQTIPAAVQSTMPVELQSINLSMELDDLTQLIQSDKDDQLSKNQQCILPVKAPADSPCERTPPAGCERITHSDPPATENEPTSTVTDTDSTVPVEVLDTEASSFSFAELAPVNNYTDKKNSVSCNGNTKGIVPADGHVATVTAGTTPADDTVTLTPALNSQQTPMEITGQSNLTPTLRLMKNPKHTAVQHSLPAGCENSFCSSTQKNNEPAKGHKSRLPTSFREILEMPSPNPTLTDVMTVDKADFWNMQQPTTLQELLTRSVPSPTQAELPEQTDSHGSPVGVKKHGDDDPDSKNAREPSGPVSRHWLPQVSLVRLPIPLTHSGHPLPRFHLLPGAADDEILLQLIEEDKQSISLDSNSDLDGSSPSGPLPLPLGHLHKVTEVSCAACRTAGALMLCAACGRGFHRDCHIPPISSACSGEWHCMLCQDLSDVEDPYSDERPKRPSLSLLDQRKCEHLLLALMCKKYGAILNHTVELSSHYIDITLIRGRLLQKLSPPYRTPSEFVSDIWVLLDTLLKNSKETDLVVKMQKFFAKKLRKIFGETLHPSLLKCPDRGPSEGTKEAKTEGEKACDTLGRIPDFIKETQGPEPKKLRQDGEPETEENSQGAT